MFVLSDRLTNADRSKRRSGSFIGSKFRYRYSYSIFVQGLRSQEISGKVREYQGGSGKVPEKSGNIREGQRTLAF